MTKWIVLSVVIIIGIIFAEKADDKRFKDLPVGAGFYSYHSYWRKLSETNAVLVKPVTSLPTKQKFEPTEVVRINL